MPSCNFFASQCSLTFEEMAVESMTVHPNSPTTNHEHNSLLTDERSSNSTVILKWNYWFVLCFYTKSPGFSFFVFLSEGLNSPFLENEYRGNERHVDTTTPTGRPNSTWDNLIPFCFIKFSQSTTNRLKLTCPKEKEEVETADQSYFHRHFLPLQWL